MDRHRGDLSKLDRDELVQIVRERFGDTPKGQLMVKLLESLEQRSSAPEQAGPPPTAEGQ